MIKTKQKYEYTIVYMDIYHIMAYILNHIWIYSGPQNEENTARFSSR